MNPTAAADTPDAQTATRHLYLDRRVCTVTPDHIEVHPARSIIILPIITLAIGLGAFPLIFFAGDSLPLGLRFAVTIAALILVPLSGLGLVYSIAGAHLVIDRAKQSAVLQQGYLGMGVGTQELVPFWKIDRIDVEELTPHDYRGHQDDFAQYEMTILRLSGKRTPIGTVTVRRAEAAEGLVRAREIATVIAEISGTKVHVARPPRDAGPTPAATS